MNITQRENEVLDLISRGYSQFEISAQLYISPHTVKTHKKNLFLKMDASNMAQLVRKGFEWGLLSLGSDLHIIKAS
ncbi:MAG: helix-turn-helix transcriptional regulator [Saprospiraceae bacterium]|nr:helix-turn-helix transcriptional regulator [Saprospiraceae bacterium]